MQDEITESVVGAIEPQLYAEEGIRLSGQPPDDISTWGLVVRAIVLASHLGQRHNEEADHCSGEPLPRADLCESPRHSKLDRLVGSMKLLAA